MDRELICAYAHLVEANCWLRAEASQRGDSVQAATADRRAEYFARVAFLEAQS